MVDTLALLAQGAAVAATPLNLLLVICGCAFGTLIGALPGLGPINGVAILLPFAYAFGLPPESALMLLAGVYYGAEYGGRISSILLNIPGDAGAVMTTLDGHPLAQAGQAGRALALSALASFIGAMLALCSLVLLAPHLARLAVLFGPAEYVALLLFAFTCIVQVAPAGALKTLIALGLGLLLAMVGIDAGTGVMRFTFGVPNLFDGVDFLAVIVGLFAMSEVFFLLRGVALTEPSWVDAKQRSRWGDLVRTRWTVLRSSFVGFFVGMLPGTGASIASTIAYGMEQRLAPPSARFGAGDLRGLAAPEAANNGAAVGAMVPMLTLGVPGSGTTAVMLGALLMYSITPGPLLFEQQPQLVWGLIVSMFLGNLALIVFNLPLVGVFARLLLVPRHWLIGIVVALSFAGIFALQGDRFDLLLVCALGALGYGLRCFGFSLIPIVLGFVLGGLFEDSLRRALSASGGDWRILFGSAVTLLFWCASALVVLLPWLRRVVRTRAAA